jgi:hypothetical protein
MRWTLALVVVCAGCAATISSAPLEPDEAARAPGSATRRELVRLDGRIASLMRERIGSERAPLSPGGAPAAEETRTTAEVESAPVPVARSPAGRPQRSWRCSRIDDAADEICDAAQRICRLAGQIGEPEAAHTCQQAEADCRRARQVASGCQ